MLNSLMISERERDSEVGWVLARMFKKGLVKSLGKSRVVVDKTHDCTFCFDSHIFFMTKTDHFQCVAKSSVDSSVSACFLLSRVPA